MAYLYRWTEKSTGKWYVGARWRKGCHPDDGYICSSKVVAPLIQSNPNNWLREILCIGNPDYIRDLERKYLTTVNAKFNSDSYNQSNATGKPVHNKPHTDVTKEKLRLARSKQTPWNKGKGGYALSAEHKKNISNGVKNSPNVGHLHTDAAKSKMSLAKVGKSSHMLGKRHSEETKRKISETKKRLSK